ncbi:MAG: integrin alpha, partial [Limnohabitans sp.]
MADTLQIITRTPNATAPTRIVAQKGVRYEIQDPTLNKQGPASLRAKRVGQDLSISFGDSAQADVVVEGFYNPDIVGNNPASVYGRGPDGLLYEYFPENKELTGMTAGLVDGASPVSQVLGGSPVAGLVGAEVGALLPVVAAFNPLTAVLIGVGVAAAAGGGGGGVALDTTAPTPTLHSEGRIASAGSSSVSSTEPGTAYLVNSTLKVTSVADILALTDSQYNSVAIGSANTPTNLAMTGLAAGTYKLYVVDAAGNLSAGTGNTVDVYPAVNLSTVAAGINGFVINGQSNNDRSGFSVSNAGDVNGDGLADVIVGAYGANSTAGKSYVVFGQTGTMAINLSAVEAGTGGFVINGRAVEQS